MAKRTWVFVAALVGLLALELYCYRSVLGLELLGWDTWPFVASSRVESLGDVARILGEKSMGGRYPHGDFYRPVTSFSFSLDWALWGSAARGYHVTDLAVLLATTTLVFLLARRLLKSSLAALVAAAVHAFHPGHFDLVTSPARRVETLTVLFALAALVALPCAGKRGAVRWVRLAFVALFTLLAIGAKETGVIVPGLVFLLAAIEGGGGSAAEGDACELEPRRGGLVARLRSGLVPAVLCAAVVAAFVVVRQRVLGGLGGHEESSLEGGFQVGRWMSAATRFLFAPQPAFGPSELGRSLDGALPTVFAALLGAGAALVAWKGCPRERGALLLAVAWLFAVLVMSAVAGIFRPWHVGSLLPPFALFCGVLAAQALRAWRAGGRVAGATALAPVALVLLALLSTSGLVRAHREWRTLSADQAAFCERLRTLHEITPPGTSLVVGGMPFEITRAPGRVGPPKAWGMTGYSAQAWCDVVLGQGEVRIVLSRQGLQPRLMRADEVVFGVVPKPYPVERRR